MPTITPTKYAQALYEKLTDLGIICSLEYYDGHKHIDICIPSAHIFIEVDGLVHFTDPDRIIADFKRNHFSDGDDFDTIHIPNITVRDYLPEVATAIAEVVRRRTNN